MRPTLAIVALCALFQLSAGVVTVHADETVVLACRVNAFAFPSPVLIDVLACDKSAGVAVACPPPTFDPFSGAGVPCAQVLANFLSTPGLKLKDVRSGGFDSTIYTLTKP